jgi:hypothetical protein
LSVTSAVLVAKGKTIIWLGAPPAIRPDCICGAEEVAPAVRVPAVGKVGMLGDDPEQALTASAKNAHIVFGMIDLRGPTPKMALTITRYMSSFHGHVCSSERDGHRLQYEEAKQRHQQRT